MLSSSLLIPSIHSPKGSSFLFAHPRSHGKYFELIWWRKDPLLPSSGLCASSLQTTPLYVMDEIDAALDFRNVSIVANYIKERTKNAQFIIISLRNNMFELADRLVGIYKTNNCTKSITIDPKAFSNQGQTARCNTALNDRTNQLVETNL
jgi:Chromosome segregation ATPases